MKKIIYFWGSACVFFESDTVKTDCPVQIFRKMIKYLEIKYRLFVNLTSLLFFMEIKKKSSEKEKKKKKKKSSENDQLTGHFQSFFFLFFSSPTIKSENCFPVNQLIKKSGLTTQKICLF